MIDEGVRVHALLRSDGDQRRTEVLRHPESPAAESRLLSSRKLRYSWSHIL